MKTWNSDLEYHSHNSICSKILIESKNGENNFFSSLLYYYLLKIHNVHFHSSLLISLSKILNIFVASATSYYKSSSDSSVVKISFWVTKCAILSFGGRDLKSWRQSIVSSSSSRSTEKNRWRFSRYIPLLLQL